ncbi:hypothetical protein LMG27952_07015 [Paraburkholderia hiiakae]|uniref:DUF2345 domain-containing protein n=2 Tax=Paraburkholderia hiiakae TaxID=1081782 RepID=A0ABN7IDW2_9BURK|nr:hypothetical protein LMG27952_07015 [Paraburkholderia hiiakae]
MITTYDRPGASGKQLDMQETIAQLEGALATAKALAASATSAKAEAADIDAQQQMKEDFDGLKKPGLLMSTPASAGIVAGQGIQLAAQDNISTVAGKNADWSVLKRWTVAAGEKITLFAQKFGVKIFAAKGPVDFQAQDGPMSFTADKDVNVASVNGKVNLAAAKEIILECGGAFIHMKDGSITLGGPFDLFVKTITVQKKGKEPRYPVFQALPIMPGDADYHEQYRLLDDDGKTPLRRRYYEIHSESGKMWSGYSDNEGLTERVYTKKPEKMTIKFSKEEGDNE